MAITHTTPKLPRIGDYAVISGTLVVQLTSDPANPDRFVPPPTWLETAVDQTGVLRRPNGGVIVRTHDGMQELKLAVAHRPAYCASPATLSSLLKRLVQDAKVPVHASDVFHGQQRTATTAELRAELAALDAEADDLTVPLAQRRLACDAADRLRDVIGVDDGHDH
jgi:hypothetical protein